ncbi:hypothetical protein WUBG_04605 [Wuchereria bancrofti]|uniref:Uncharacterized protein n=1 Tax=Wuchereria bancrofti TaxID=6293 RepID=J9BBG7_WUCBA|nr:hypothetical protein WUBG_04605 [Wuchereria bancrofti]
MRLFICVHATYVFTARSSTLHHPINGISSLQLVTFKIAIRNFARKPASILCVAAQPRTVLYGALRNLEILLYEGMQPEWELVCEALDDT